MKLEFVAVPAGKQAVSRWAGERTLILGGPRGGLHSIRLYCHQLSDVGVRIPCGAGNHGVMLATSAMKNGSDYLLPITYIPRIYDHLVV